jgi:ethanolamine ammonia-lyase small subunit
MWNRDGHRDDLANFRDEYLRRPDLGRRLGPQSSQQLLAINHPPCELVLIVGDGLSAMAAVRHVVPLLARLVPELSAQYWKIAPLVIASRARVGLMDEVGEVLKADLSLMLLGERPGLSACDSLGAYFVFGPDSVRTDADRNCVSNIRPDGLATEAAARALLFLLNQERQTRLSGVALQDTRGLELGDQRHGLIS